MSAKHNLPKAQTSGVDLSEVRRVIARATPEDFDGHTEFSRLTPQERLEWLDSAVTFIEAAKARLVKQP
jgi:hypothetical protein